MPVARAAHSAVAVADGRVLLIGGCVRESCEAGPDSSTRLPVGATRSIACRNWVTTGDTPISSVSVEASIYSTSPTASSASAWLE